MSVLTDTNVISELARPRPHPSVVRWVQTQRMLAVSVITVEEIHFGLTAKQNARVQQWFERFFEDHCRVVDVSAQIARHAGILRAQHSTRGRVRSQADMLIAATAAQHGLAVATRNTRDFDDCGVSVVNPFES
ncbi:MAG: type II toxin-antitoxin system VapC family toxin [Kofleriaceae bacterium]|nr:type II toxin-antitoxin system VapC family toxin [Kofleriaceae bacterium]